MGIHHEVSSGEFAVRGIWNEGASIESRCTGGSCWGVMLEEERAIETMSRLRMP